MEAFERFAHRHLGHGTLVAGLRSGVEHVCAPVEHQLCLLQVDEGLPGVPKHQLQLLELAPPFGGGAELANMIGVSGTAETYVYYPVNSGYPEMLDVMSVVSDHDCN